MQGTSSGACLARLLPQQETLNLTTRDVVSNRLDEDELIMALGRKVLGAGQNDRSQKQVFNCTTLTTMIYDLKFGSSKCQLKWACKLAPVYSY